MILADTAFSSIEFLHGIRKLKYHAVTGIPINRKLIDGRIVRHLHKQGQQVRLVGLKFPVTVSWYYLKRDNGKRRIALCSVYSTKLLLLLSSGGVSVGPQIEGWFKTALASLWLTSFWAR